MTTEPTTPERVAAAMQAANFDALRDAIAPDAVLRSPITSSFEFRGREQILELLGIVRDAYDDLEYTDLRQDGDLGIQVFRVRIAGQATEGLDLMRLDEQGRVREFTVFFRPLPGLAVLTEALATRIAAREGRPMAVVARALIRPLVLLTRLGDPLGRWLLRRTFGRRG